MKCKEEKNNKMEQSIIKLVAQDRIEMPLSSMYQKLRKEKKVFAIDLANLVDNAGGAFEGQRVFAYTSTEDKERARGMKEAVSDFCTEFPKYGQILQGKIAEKRVRAEEHLYFGVNAGSRLTADDYMEVMHSLGLSQTTARGLYPELMDISRKLARAKDEDRSVIVGKYAKDTD